MATSSTKLDKAKSDIKKLNAAESLERKRVPAVSKWFITQQQLDAQHIEHAKKNNVTALTLDDFRRRFFDGRSYIAKRENAAFGSARNPHDNSISFEENAYVPLPIRTRKAAPGKLKSKHSSDSAEKLVNLNQLTKLLVDGGCVVLLAPFGGGKSLTTREAFNQLASSYRKGAFNMVPVAINLREHWGQDYFDEILERHARSIGYLPKEDLVVAWRAGMITLLLDGFDEVASQAIIRTDDKNFMRDARRAALQGVRDLLLKIPQGVGLWICGRDHYFDNEQELVHALGLSVKEYSIARLDEFTEEGAHEFLVRNGVDRQLPDWLPRKPLLLSYLTQHNLMDDILQIDPSYGFGYSWDNFLNKIVNREASLERAAMDPDTLRAVMERLSFVVRSRPSGAGPVTGNDLSDAYNIETGQAAGEGVLAQLQRLPGLTQRDESPGARSFVDEDMLAALQGGAFAKLILGHYKYETTIPVTELSPKAISMAAYLLNKNAANCQTVISVIMRLGTQAKLGAQFSQYIADCFTLSLEMALTEELTAVEYRGLIVSGAVLGRINLEDISISGVEFRSCVIGEMVLGSISVKGGFKVSDCIISKLSGVADRGGVPDDIFESTCEIEEFDDMGTNNAVLDMDLPPQLKALITVLRKLYRQAGAGRKISALSRGIGREDVARYVDPVLGVLESKSMITVFNKVIHPVRKQSSRMDKILSAPMLSNDPVVKDILQL